MTFNPEQLKFDAQGLIPAIIQDVKTGQVLMMAYMNKESLQKTLDSGQTWFYSRSRQQLWHKGETSGHLQMVQELSFDCDADTLLIKVNQIGVACHTGEKSCFHNPIIKAEKEIQPGSPEIIRALYDLILERQKTLPEGSYTTYLFTKGLDKILKKVGEESAEVIIGAKNRDKAEVTYEVADLFYHVLVLLVEQGVTPEDIFQELAGRQK